MMKKTICAILGITLLGVLLFGCGTEDTGPAASQTEGESGAVGSENAAEAVPGESIRTNGGEIISLASLEHQDETSDTVVYYTSDISPEAMVAAYDALGVELTGENIAVKLSTGEPPAMTQIPISFAPVEKYRTEYSGYRPLFSDRCPPVCFVSAVCAPGSDDNGIWR